MKSEYIPKVAQFQLPEGGSFTFHSNSEKRSAYVEWRSGGPGATVSLYKEQRFLDVTLPSVGDAITIARAWVEGE